MTNVRPPLGLRWRSSRTFIIATVAFGLFTDLFLYGIVVPVLPFMLVDRLSMPPDQVQSQTSVLLAAYALSSLLASVPIGWLADMTTSRQLPYLLGLSALLASTLLLALGREMWVLIVARILQGISAAAVWTVGMAVVIDTVGPQNLGKVIGSTFSFISVGELISPVVGGILYKKAGMAGVFGLSAAMLVLDFAMRVLIIEKKFAAKYSEFLTPEESDTDPEATEEDRLLPGDADDADEERYKIKETPGKLLGAMPLLYCFRNPRLVMALALGFVQALIMGIFDATITTEAQDLFGFTSLEAGLLYIALDVPYLVLGAAAGYAVDRYGAKPAAVIGFGYFVPALVVLRIPSEQLLPRTNNIVLYCALLCLNGVGLAIVSSPSIVEASDVVGRYDKANPGFFGDNGPYAQLYGFTSVFFSAGLTVGPLLGGVLRDSIGYGNMNAVFAAISGVTAVLSYFLLGGKMNFWCFGGRTRE